MPYSIKKCDCRDSKGKKGKYIITKKGKGKALSCHTSKKKAQAAVRARYANESYQILSDSIYFAVICELSKKKKSLSGSHPDESYEPFSDKEFDKDGKTTSHSIVTGKLFFFFDNSHITAK